MNAWKWRDLKKLRAAEINRVALKSDDINESEAAGTIRREIL